MHMADSGVLCVIRVCFFLYVKIDSCAVCRVTEIKYADACMQ